MPPTDVRVDSQFASIDYRYLQIPGKAVSLHLYSGNRQLSSNGQEELIQVGIQAATIEFEDLAPMNLAFVIDKSGSMSGQDKMDWVNDAFGVFIERVRENDFVALITFDNEAKTVFPSTRMTRENRLRFREQVGQVTPGGGKNLVAGLELGYGQVMSNFRADYTNRVLFLTDGVGDSYGILEMAAEFNELGINVSTIGVGSDFDVNLMVDLATEGGGSSRFISDREEMEEIFGSELDRMLVPAVRNFELRLLLPRGFEILETWGYQHQILGREARYAIPTLHHRDYQTILARISVPQGHRSGSSEVERLTATYQGTDGAIAGEGPIVLEAEFVDDMAPVLGYSDGMVLRSGTMLHFAQSLILIGELYYSTKGELDEISALRDHL